jgi:hypothetical protein
MPSLFEKRPECPGNREDYVWVKSKNGGHWRKKRGRVKKAVLNPVFAKNANNTGLTNEAAGRVVNMLQPFLNGIKKGDFYNRLAGKLKKVYNRAGTLSFSLTKEMNLQDEYPLEKLLIAGYHIEKTGGNALVRIPIDNYSVKRHSELVTNYYFELIMVYGDAGEAGGLQTESVISPVYPIHSPKSADCVMQLAIPDVPWIMILKLSCIEGNELAHSSRNYGMKVVASC